MSKEYRNESENGRAGTEETLRFFRHLFGKARGFVCIATADRNGGSLEDLRHTYYPYPDQVRAAAAHALAESGRGREVYYACNLLKEATERTKVNAARVRTLWSDLDDAQVPEEPRPTALLETSEGRWQAHWRLSKAISPQQAERLTRRLTYAVGADRSKWALSSLLRPPRTINHKRDEPWEVRLVGLDAALEYDPDELDRLLPPLSSANGRARGEASRGDAADLGEPPIRLGLREVRIWRGLQPKYKPDGEIDRSASLYKIGGMLARAGASVRVIAEALEERDRSLSWNKYSARDDNGPYIAIAQKVVAKAMEDGPDQLRRDELRRIVTNDRPLRDVGDDALGALHERNTPPTLFARSGKIIRLGADEHGEPIIEEAGESVVRHHLTRSADFVRESERKDGVARTEVDPPRSVVQDVMAVPQLPFPPLIGVPRTPFFRPDGTIMAQAGYDAATRLLYVPASEGFRVEVPQEPSKDDLKAALALLDEAVGDLPFVDKHSAANTLALLLTPILRNVIEGPVPLSAISKPVAGTGGSLLAEVVSLIATGSPAGMMSAPREDEEFRKQLTAALMRGNLVVTIDNVDSVLAAPSLSRALSSEHWEDRVLGRSEMTRLPQRATWIASGNNLQVGGDLPRRTYWIRLDAGEERPWQRGGFRHPKLKQWVTENRERLVSALLTMGRAWYVKGRPEGSSSIGGFEGWSHTIGGVLEVADVSGFLGNLDEMYERAADGTHDWSAFLEAWREAYGDEARTTKQLAADLHNSSEEYAALREALPDEFGIADPERPDKALSRRLGNRFKKREGKPHGERRLCLKRAGSRMNAKLWQVVEAPTGAGESVSLVSLVSLPPPNLHARARVNRESGAKQTKQTNRLTAEPRTSSSETDTSSSEGSDKHEQGLYNPYTEADAPEDLVGEF